MSTKNFCDYCNMEADLDSYIPKGGMDSKEMENPVLFDRICARCQKFYAEARNAGLKYTPPYKNPNRKPKRQ